MQVKALSIAVMGICAVFASGCTDKESGMKQFVPPSPAQVQKYQAAQIKSVQDNPNIPADQKQRIIALYSGGNKPQTSPTAGPAASH